MKMALHCPKLGRHSTQATMPTQKRKQIVNAKAAVNPAADGSWMRDGRQLIECNSADTRSDLRHG
jgi:hypothetical protein